jgi:hypothetical protein
MHRATGKLHFDIDPARFDAFEGHGHYTPGQA